jgi:hypothetical protein
MPSGDAAGAMNGKDSLLGPGQDSSGGWKGVVGAANAMDFGFWRDEHLDGGGWLDAPLCASRAHTMGPLVQREADFYHSWLRACLSPQPRP